MNICSREHRLTFFSGVETPRNAEHTEDKSAQKSIADPATTQKSKAERREKVQAAEQEEKEKEQAKMHELVQEMEMQSPLAVEQAIKQVDVLLREIARLEGEEGKEKQLKQAQNALADERAKLLGLGAASIDAVIREAGEDAEEGSSERNKFFADVARDIAKEHPAAVRHLTMTILRQPNGQVAIASRNALAGAGPQGIQALLRIVDGRAWEDVLPPNAQSPAMKEFLAQHGESSPGAARVRRLFGELTVPLGEKDRRPGILAGSLVSAWKEWHEEYEKKNRKPFSQDISLPEGVDLAQLLSGLASSNREKRADALLALNRIPSVPDRLRIIGHVLTQKGSSLFSSGVCYLCRNGQVVEEEASVATLQEQILSLGKDNGGVTDKALGFVEQSLTAREHAARSASDALIEAASRHSLAHTVLAVEKRMEQKDVGTDEYVAFTNILLHQPSGCELLQFEMEARGNEKERLAIAKAVSAYCISMLPGMRDNRYRAHDGEEGPRELVNLLSAMLRDPLPDVRQAAVQGLTRMIKTEYRNLRASPKLLDPVRERLHALASQADLPQKERLAAQDALDEGIEQYASYEPLLKRAQDVSLPPAERARGIEMLAREARRDQTLFTFKRKDTLRHILEALQALAATDTTNHHELRPIRQQARAGIVTIIGAIGQPGEISASKETAEDASSRDQEEAYRESIVADGMKRISILIAESVRGESGFTEIAASNGMINQIITLLRSERRENALAAIKLSQDIHREFPWDDGDFITEYIPFLVQCYEKAAKASTEGTKVQQQHATALRQEMVHFLTAVIEHFNSGQVRDDAGFLNQSIEIIHKGVPETAMKP